MRRYFDKQDVAGRYGVSRHTVASWVKIGYIPFLRCGRLVRFDEASLDRWDEERATDGRSQITPEVV